MVELVLRLVVSLSLVLGLLLLLARLSARRVRGTSGSVIQVLHRQQLTRSSSVAVVSVGDRVLVLGTTEQQVQLLTELAPTEVAPEAARDTPAQLTLEEPPAQQVPAPKHRAQPSYPTPTAGHAARLAAVRAADGALVGSAVAGSVLSPQTWRQALAAVSGREQDAS